MQSYFYLHKENTEGPQERYRNTYVLQTVDYEFHRSVDKRGEIISELKGGKITITIDGFADSLLLAWLFDDYIKEDGAIIMMDENEKDIEKLHFSNATVSSFHMNYDSKSDNGVSTSITIRAKEMKTDKDLQFCSK